MENYFLIYMHTAPNGKSYIGQTCNLANRNSSHRNDTSCRLFAKAIRKYGWDAFDHKILLEGLSIEDANRLEKEFITSFNTQTPRGYNIKPGGKNTPHHDETKRLISQAHMGKVVSPDVRKKISATQQAKSPEEKAETARKLREANLGKKASLETRKKLSDARKGKPKKLTDAGRAAISATHKGKIVSAETREKMSIAKKGLAPTNKRLPMSEEQKKRISEAKKNPTEETRKRIAIGAKAAWANRRENGTAFLSPEHKAKIGESRRSKKEAAQGDLFA